MYLIACYPSLHPTLSFPPAPYTLLPSAPCTLLPPYHFLLALTSRSPIAFRYKPSSPLAPSAPLDISAPWQCLSSRSSTSCA